jgi:hypothetical protein
VLSTLCLTHCGHRSQKASTESVCDVRDRHAQTPLFDDSVNFDFWSEPPKQRWGSSSRGSTPDEPSYVIASVALPTGAVVERIVPWQSQQPDVVLCVWQPFRCFILDRQWRQYNPYWSPPEHRSTRGAVGFCLMRSCTASVAMWCGLEAQRHGSVVRSVFSYRLPLWTEPRRSRSTRLAAI